MSIYQTVHAAWDGLSIHRHQPKAVPDHPAPTLYEQYRNTPFSPQEHGVARQPHHATRSWTNSTPRRLTAQIGHGFVKIKHMSKCTGVLLMIQLIS
jgi:hypothetical protein